MGGGGWGGILFSGAKSCIIDEKNTLGNSGVLDGDDKQSSLYCSFLNYHCYQTGSALEHTSDFALFISNHKIKDIQHKTSWKTLRLICPLFKTPRNIYY